MNWLKKIFSLSFFTIILAIIYKIFCYMSQYICVYAESTFCPYINYSSFLFKQYCHPVFEIFSHSDHCWYIYSAIFSFIEKKVPFILNMHPQEAILVSSKLILFPIFVVLLLTMAINLFKYSKHKKIFLIGFGMLFSLFMVLSAFAGSEFLWVFSSDCWFIAYVFHAILGLAFYCFAEYFYVTEKKPSPKDIGIMTILLVCIAVSHEYFKFILFFAVPVVYLLHNAIFKPAVRPKKFLKDFLIFAVIVAVCSSNLFSQMYIYWLNRHIAQNVSFFQDSSYVSSFWQAYKDYILYDNLYYFLTIGVLTLSIILSVNDKNKNKRLFIAIYSVIVASLLFFAALIVGSDHYDNYQNFVLPMHQGLRTMFKYMLITISFSCFGYLTSNCKDSLLNQVISFVKFSIICVCLFWTNSVFFVNCLKYQQQVRISSYILEKMFVLNKKINKDNIFYTYNNLRGFNNNSIKYLIYFYESDYKQDESEIYYVCLPNDDIYVCQNKMIEKIYEKTGYQITEQELKDLNFSSLYKLNKNGI